MKMIRFLLLAGLVTISLTGCNPLKFSVLYGNRSLKDFDVMHRWILQDGINSKDSLIDVVRFYFDREGILYPPDCRIPNDLMRANNYTFGLVRASLFQFTEDRLHLHNYSSDKDTTHFFYDFARVYQKYYDKYNAQRDANEPLAVPAINSFDERNLKDEIDQISIDRYLKRINDTIAKHHYDNVTFLMTGFNNTLVNEENAFNSSEMKIRLQREKIQDIVDSYNRELPAGVAKRKTLFVEVHWDGKFTEKKGLQTGINYRPALRTSYKVGLMLRKIIDCLADTTVSVHLISHSSGANIVCESMFNQISKIKRKGKENALWEYLNVKYQFQEELYSTPRFNRRIVAGMLAPSIPGVETFADYYQRTQPVKEDQYRLVVGYNTNDHDLRKRFGNFWIGTIVNAVNSRDRLVKQNVFGSTALGCLQPEVERVKDMFRKSYPPENIRFIDFSFSEANGYKAANYIHPVEQYVNTPQYKDFVRSVYLASEKNISSIIGSR